ncbi:Autophagy-related protein 17, partial [Exophiala xenobiotica]
KQMERVIAQAHSQLEQMYEQDRQLRVQFRDDLGEFLPGDIWPGVNALPPRFEIHRIDEDGFDASVPDLPQKTVEDAARRFKTGR